MKLNNTKIDNILANGKPGRYSDGHGLYLKKSPTNTACWVLMYRRNGKLRELGLGSYTAVARVTLKQARLNALKIRAQIGSGEDPLAEKKRSAPSASFRAMMEAKIASMMVAWGARAEMNSKDYRSTLTLHAAKLMDVSVAKITTDKVLEALKREVTTKQGVTGPLWTTQAETAKRVLERIATILDYAKGKGLCDSVIEAKTIRNLLGAQKSADAEKEHHVPMAQELIQPFFARLKAVEGLAARALELIVLTGARLSEVREMAWPEIDLDAGLWTCPKERMKSRKAHTFTLSTQAIELLKALPRFAGSDTVFWSAHTGKPFASVTIRRHVLREKLGVTPEQADIHGFRACFESWVHNNTNFGMALAHQATAHAHKDEETGKHNSVLNVYQKGKALEKRALMLQSWADWLDGKSNANILVFAKKEAA